MVDLLMTVVGGFAVPYTGTYIPGGAISAVSTKGACALEGRRRVKEVFREEDYDYVSLKRVTQVC
jgi:hypothetical protein